MDAGTHMHNVINKLFCAQNYFPFKQKPIINSFLKTTSPFRQGNNKYIHVLYSSHWKESISIPMTIQMIVSSNGGHLLQVHRTMHARSIYLIALNVSTLNPLWSVIVCTFDAQSSVYFVNFVVQFAHHFHKIEQKAITIKEAKSVLCMFLIFSFRLNRCSPKVFMWIR